MLRILNLEEAKKWSNENLYEADLYLFPLKKAVKMGLLIEIDKEHFAVAETECFGCTWYMDSIKVLSDKEMKDNDLCCRYRYQEHVTTVPDRYEGTRVISAGFNL